MLMMKNDHTHTEEAVSAAKSNLKGIAVKAKALSKSSKDFDRITAEALKTLESQNKDRATIMSAVTRAGEVEGNTDGAPVLALLQELQQELHAQDTAVREYEKKQSAFKTQFQQYVTGYLQLLKERERHYQSSLSSLNLYADELGSHENTQTEALKGEDELNHGSEDLCDTIMSFYERRTKRRTELRASLKAVVPQVPGILLFDGDSNSDSSSDSDSDDTQ